jgi:hypothetical protein
MIAARTTARAALFCTLIAVLASAAAAVPAVWKLVPTAFLRIDDEGVKEWSVFQIEKKNDRFLLQIGERYLLIDAQKQRVFEISPGAVEHRGADLLWDPEKLPSQPLATSDWVVRDVGLAERIKMRLQGEGRTIDLQIPHPTTRR